MSETAVASDLELVVRQGQHPGRVFDLPVGVRKTIGRAPECDIRLPDQGVSRRHATIENLGQLLEVVDLESANGSYINGAAIQKGTLKPGDQLALGPTLLECRSRPERRRDYGPGSAKIAFREEGTHTVVRKVVDTHFPGVAADESKQEDLKNLLRAQRNLATAYRVSKLLASAQDLDELFTGVLDSIMSAISADRAALLLRVGDDGSEPLRVMRARDRNGNGGPGEITVSRTVVQDVLEHGVSTLSQDATADARYRTGQSIIQQQIRSVMCAPVSTDDSVLGVLYADSRSRTGAFSESDLELMALIGNQAGVAIQRAQLREQLEQFFFDTIRAIIATIDAKDGYTHRHSERVAAFATRIAGQLGLSAEEIASVELAALLHDVGKIGVPESILNKPGRLTDAEFEQVKKHCLYGVKILGHIQSPRFDQILPGVRNHHERWDGSGYPDGLAGDDIPFLGRLLAVADVLDALSSNRSYRAGLGFDKTVEIIEQGSGSHFDPEIAAAAVALHQRGQLDVPAAWIEPATRDGRHDTSP